MAAWILPAVTSMTGATATVSPGANPIASIRFPDGGSIGWDDPDHGAELIAAMQAANRALARKQEDADKAEDLIDRSLASHDHRERVRLLDLAEQLIDGGNDAR